MLAIEHRRSNLEVVADILRLGQAGKTEIMQAVGMNHGQLRRYLSLLVQRRLLSEITRFPGPVTYKVTPRGLKLLKEIETLLETLKGRGR